MLRTWGQVRQGRLPESGIKHGNGWEIPYTYCRGFIWFYNGKNKHGNIWENHGKSICTWRLIAGKIHRKKNGEISNKPCFDYWKVMFFSNGTTIWLANLFRDFMLDKGNGAKHGGWTLCLCLSNQHDWESEEQLFLSLPSVNVYQSHSTNACWMDGDWKPRKKRPIGGTRTTFCTWSRFPVHMGCIGKPKKMAVYIYNHIYIVIYIYIYVWLL